MRHFLDHLGLQYPARRKAQEHVGIADDIPERTGLGFAGIARLVVVHFLLAPVPDHALDVRYPDVPHRQAKRNQKVKTGQRRGTGPGTDQLYLAYLLADDTQSIEQRCADDDGGAVLIVVKHRDAHALAQFSLNIKAFRRLDILEIDSAECRFQGRDDIDQLVGIALVDLDVEAIDAREFLEQHGLAFHDRLGRKGTNRAQSKDCSTVCYDPD